VSDGTTASAGTNPTANNSTVTRATKRPMPKSPQSSAKPPTPNARQT
jgi:hypothetical protein